MRSAIISTGQRALDAAGSPPCTPPNFPASIMPRRLLLLASAVTCALAVCDPAAAQDVTFEKHIRPILKANCFQCHGEAEEHKGKLDVRLARLMAKGGESGAAIVPGKPEESLLFRRVRDGEMPEGDKKLTKEQVALIGQWIAGGAKTIRPQPEDPAQLVFTEEERSLLSFQPVLRPPLPCDPAASSGRAAPQASRTPIDLFLLQKLAEKSLGFSVEAHRETLIRRSTFDLTGLPPT